MLLWFYRMLFVPAVVVLAPYYLWRMRRRGGYRDSFAQRFGAVSREWRTEKSGQKRIWLQAVSVGELLAVEPLVRALAEEAGWEVYLTTTTSTGFRLARERHAGRVAAVGYFPLDFWWFSARAWSAVEPDLVILTEGERWPEHIHQARRRGVPVLNINARLSDRSFRRMRVVRRGVPGLLGDITKLLAVSQEDARRFAEIGFAEDRIRTVGNLKVDNTLVEIDAAAKLALRAELGFGAEDRVFLGSSTWAGEEEAVVAAWEAARSAGGEARTPWRLLLVPRHAERGPEIERWLATGGHSFHVRSRGAAPGPVDICLADTTGELQRLTQVADLVFVGKSLPPHMEGQTPIEAAGLGRPLLLGPGMSSFRGIARDLVDTGAAEMVANADELAERVTALMADEGLRLRRGEAGRAWHQRNRGALAATLTVVRDLLNASIRG